jgi:hypothetical protein
MSLLKYSEIHNVIAFSTSSISLQTGSFAIFQILLGDFKSPMLTVALPTLYAFLTLIISTYPTNGGVDPDISWVNLGTPYRFNESGDTIQI